MGTRQSTKASPRGCVCQPCRDKWARKRQIWALGWGKMESRRQHPLLRAAQALLKAEVRSQEEGNGLSWGWFVGVCLELPLLNYLAGSKHGEIVTASKPADLGLLC